MLCVNAPDTSSKKFCFYFFCPWNAKEFLPPQRQVWIFEHSGLCEPLSVRVDSEHGYVEMTFNALDAHAEAASKSSAIK